MPRHLRQPRLKSYLIRAQAFHNALTSFVEEELRASPPQPRIHSSFTQRSLSSANAPPHVEEGENFIRPSDSPHAIIVSNCPSWYSTHGEHVGVGAVA